MKSSTEKAKETASRELKSEPLESVIDGIIAERLEINSSVLEREKYFEVPDKMVMFYKYSYGMQSRFFRELKYNAVLYGTRCAGCGIVHFPPRASCPECLADTEWTRVSDNGTILAGTTSWYATSEFFNKVPYAVAYVKPVDADTAMLQRIDLRGSEHADSGTAVVAMYREKERRKGVISDFWYEIVD